MIDIRIEIKTLLRISVYAAAYFGLIHLILDIWAFGGSVFGIWSDVFNDLFTTGLAVTLLLGLRAVVESLLPDDSPPLTEAIPQDWRGRMAWVIERPGVMFRAGVYIVPFIGMIRLVLDLVASRNSPPAQIWAGLFFSLFTTFAVIGFLVAVRAVVDWFEGKLGSKVREYPPPSTSRELMEQVIDQPLSFLKLLTNIVILSGLLLTLTQVFAARGVGPSAMWSLIAGNLFLVTAAASLLIASRAIIKCLYEMSESANPPITLGVPQLTQLEQRLSNPSEFLRIVTYLVAYLGAINYLLGILAVRNALPSTIWSFAFVSMFTTAAAVSILIGTRAILDWFEKQRETSLVSVERVRTGVGELFEKYTQLGTAQASDTSSERPPLLKSLNAPRYFLYAALFVVGALGGLYIISDLVALGAGRSFARYLYNFVTNLTQVGAAVVVVLILIAILDSLGTGKEDSDS